MKFIPAKCPSCNGELQVPDDRDFVKCMYCGVDIKIRETVKMIIEKNIPNLLKLGTEMINAKNYDEANNNYSEVLESDVNNSEAWYGKALALLLKLEYNTFERKNINEISSYFSNYLRNVSPEKKSDEIKKISEKIFHVCNTEYEKTYEKKYFSNSNEYYLYAGKLLNIFYTLESALSFNKDKNIYYLLIHLGRKILKGGRVKELRYSSQGSIYQTVGYLIQEQLEIQDRVKNYDLTLREIDSEWANNWKNNLVNNYIADNIKDSIKGSIKNIFKKK